MIRELLHEAEVRMVGSVHALESDLATFRTGRASPALLDRITAEVYGSVVALKQIALISVPEPSNLPSDHLIQVRLVQLNARFSSRINRTKSNRSLRERLHLPAPYRHIRAGSIRSENSCRGVTRCRLRRRSRRSLRFLAASLTMS